MSAHITDEKPEHSVPSHCRRPSQPPASAEAPKASNERPAGDAGQSGLSLDGPMGEAGEGALGSV